MRRCLSAACASPRCNGRSKGIHTASMPLATKTEGLSAKLSGTSRRDIEFSQEKEIRESTRQAETTTLNATPSRTWERAFIILTVSVYDAFNTGSAQAAFLASIT